MRYFNKNVDQLIDDVSNELKGGRGGGRTMKAAESKEDDIDNIIRDLKGN